MLDAVKRNELFVPSDTVVAPLRRDVDENVFTFVPLIPRPGMDRVKSLDPVGSHFVTVSVAPPSSGDACPETTTWLAGVIPLAFIWITVWVSGKSGFVVKGCVAPEGEAVGFVP